MDDDGTTARVRHPLSRSAGLVHSVGPVVGQNPEHFDVWAEGGPEPVVGVLGLFDATTVDEVAPYLNPALAEAAESVTVDFTFVSLLAGAGVDALFRLNDQATALDRQITRVAPYGTPAQHILGLVGLPHEDTST